MFCAFFTVHFRFAGQKSDGTYTKKKHTYNRLAIVIEIFLCVYVYMYQNDSLHPINVLLLFFYAFLETFRTC